MTALHALLFSHSISSHAYRLITSICIGTHQILRFFVMLAILALLRTLSVYSTIVAPPMLPHSVYFPAHTPTPPDTAERPALGNCKVVVIHANAQHTCGKTPCPPCLLCRLTRCHATDLRPHVTLDTPLDTPYSSHSTHTSALHTHHLSTTLAVTRSLDDSGPPDLQVPQPGPAPLSHTLSQVAQPAPTTPQIAAPRSHPTLYTWSPRPAQPSCTPPLT